MLRGGRQVSAQDTSKQQQQQKQKKRLSFRDPEVEGPQKHSLYTGCRSKTLARPTKVTTTTKKSSCSVEDLTLEDQALLIAQNVGNAFSNSSAVGNGQFDFLDSIPSDLKQQKETEIVDSSVYNSAEYKQDSYLPTTTRDQEYLNAFVSSSLNSTMKGPSVEEDNSSPINNCIPVHPGAFESRPSTSMQHQIQLLRYQLEQQNQQTQMALHQVQLLQDQMNAESVARRKAQEQNNQLMQQNRELLSHMEKLFQQIEDLEKQIHLLEQDKLNKRTFSNPDQVIRGQPMPYSGIRRSSIEQISQDKTISQNRGLYTTPRRPSLTSSKPVTANSKPAATQSTTTVNRKTSIVPPKLTIQSKNTDQNNKTKETLRIGDMSQSTKSKETLQIGDTSPPVQSGTLSPFGSAWKLKSQEDSNQSTSDKNESTARGRTGSFSSFVRKPQEVTSSKSTLFSSSSNLSTTSITNKKHSSSTSDLYNNQSTFQSKSLSIDEPPLSPRGSISSLSINTSKLPRYQPYTGWRRASLTNDTEQVSAVSKDGHKNAPQSLFNR